MQFIEGGVTAPEGFTANGMLCGIKPGRTKNDTALIFSERPCAAAGMFTRNRVKAESVRLTMRNIADGKAQAVIANSGNANACTGQEGALAAKRMADCASRALGISGEDVIVCSTGVIGVRLPVEVIERNIDALASGLSKDGHKAAREAIMTTDTRFKECAVETEIGGKKVRLGTMCKGSGMIHINLGTMLSFVTTDCAITSAMLKKALERSVAGTYNCVSVDGDTSTNDTLTVLANGMAGNPLIDSEGGDFDIFCEALDALNTVMAKKIAADGEGATRLIECNVRGAQSQESARALAKAVISSSLVKAAMFGCDANFGRFLCAMGYSGIDFNPDRTSIWFTSRPGAERYFDETLPFEVHGEDSVQVFKDGAPVDFDEDLARKIMGREAVEILVQCADGDADGTAWGCDLTYDYVKINGDYRT
ncbi:MAG: bifunctional glutamate N-acetyltransferase/amino-acid acetyltransferase ArgJ [Treponema sp.]|nr:bifunctional glutamate N-acetyltransferase/amino-acid acetyltransferase ArgJ [Treponema sp.]